jgi:hypothetical protein
MSELIKVKEITKEEINEIIYFVNHICNNKVYIKKFIDSYIEYTIDKNRYDDGISYLKEFIRMKKNIIEQNLDDILNEYIESQKKHLEDQKTRLKIIIMTLLFHLSYMGDTCVIFQEYKANYKDDLYIKNFEIFIFNFVSYFCIHKKYLITKWVKREQQKEQEQEQEQELLRQIGRVNASETSLSSSKRLANITTRRSKRGGNPPKYKSTGITVRILYKKRKYKRIIYVKDTNKTKYCKIDGEYILLSKMKVI